MTLLHTLFSRPKPRDWNGEEFTQCERKLDGIRLTIIRDFDGKILAVGRKESLNYWPKIQYLSELKALIESMPPGTMVDGELHPAHGISTDVPSAIRMRQPLTYSVFAMPFLNGVDFRQAALKIVRKTLTSCGFNITPLEEFSGTRHDMQRLAVSRNIEGFVLKQFHYAGWYRIKPVHTIDAIVTATHRGKGRLENSLGSLQLAVFNGDHLIDIGRCGSGLNDDQRFSNQDLVGRVCEVMCDEITVHWKLRFPVFVRWRDDKPASECTLTQLQSRRTLRANE